MAEAPPINVESLRVRTEQKTAMDGSKEERGKGWAKRGWFKD